MVWTWTSPGPTYATALLPATDTSFPAPPGRARRPTPPARRDPIPVPASAPGAERRGPKAQDDPPTGRSTRGGLVVSTPFGDLRSGVSLGERLQGRAARTPYPYPQCAGR